MAAEGLVVSRSGTMPDHRHAEIGPEQGRIDDEDPEHRAFQHGPVSHPDAPSAHLHR